MWRLRCVTFSSTTTTPMIPLFNLPHSPVGRHPLLSRLCLPRPPFPTRCHPFSLTQSLLLLSHSISPPSLSFSPSVSLALEMTRASTPLQGVFLTLSHTSLSSSHRVTEEGARAQDCRVECRLV